ncbi:hypothetical protein LY76DRAFT_268748 [Colletotrichum caudatum]|nr:hypothetical protein LY76DRAFT_268748 [Colletotrichum caudatum]
MTGRQLWYVVDHASARLLLRPSYDRPSPSLALFFFLFLLPLRLPQVAVLHMSARVVLSLTSPKDPRVKHFLRPIPPLHVSSFVLRGQVRHVSRSVVLEPPLRVYGSFDLIAATSFRHGSTGSVDSLAPIIPSRDGAYFSDVQEVRQILHDSHEHRSDFPPCCFSQH